MRTQPENITSPEKRMEIVNSNSIWGTEYKGREKIPVWRFMFTVSAGSVFSDGISQTGNLYNDSQGIPMIIGLDESRKLQRTIDSNPLFRNIYFEVLDDEQ